MKRLFFILVILIFFGAMHIRAAYALIPVGGINVAFLVPCTCGPGYIVITTLGTMWIPPWTIITSGSGFPVANFLAWVSPGGGCWMNATFACWYWPAKFTTIQYSAGN